MYKMVLVVVTLMTGFLLAAQPSAKKMGGANAQPTSPMLANTLLWEISGRQLSHPSYLFGTMHLLCKDDAQLSNSLRTVIAQAKEIYFELDLDNMMETLGGLRYLNMNNGTKLSELLSADEYQRIKDYFKKNGSMLPFNMMEHLKPYFITALISESKFPCPEKDGMEQAIMKQAKKDNKPINGLETIQFQASVFDSIPYTRQAKDLLKMIDSSGTGTDSSDNQLVEVYRQQNLNKMQELTTDEVGMQDYLDLLLFNRNRNWVKKMPSIMQQGTVLFAVGAGHLGGAKGVIQLLQQAGYTVRPMEHKPGPESLFN